MRNIFYPPPNDGRYISERERVREREIERDKSNFVQWRVALNCIPEGSSAGLTEAATAGDVILCLCMYVYTHTHTHIHKHTQYTGNVRVR